MATGRKKVVITGATGFVGGALAHTLAGENVDLHALTRPTSDLRRVKHLPITWHVGDITKPNSLQGVFDGADWVIDTAAGVNTGSSTVRFDGGT